MFYGGKYRLCISILPSRNFYLVVQGALLVQLRCVRETVTVNPGLERLLGPEVTLLPNEYQIHLKLPCPDPGIGEVTLRAEKPACSLSTLTGPGKSRRFRATHTWPLTGDPGKYLTSQSLSVFICKMEAKAPYLTGLP